MIADMDGAPGYTPPVTLPEQITCVENELEKRQTFYPKWVAAGRMNPRKAEYEIAAMAAVLVTLKNTKQPLLL